MNNNALDDFNLPINQKVEDALDTEGMHQASPAEAIPQSNKGFQMLQKMGWKGDGLGSKEDGASLANKLLKSHSKHTPG